MSNEMIERLVEAAKTSLREDGACMLERDHGVTIVDHHVDFEDMVRAILTAMREPTDRMNHAGRDSLAAAAAVQNVQGDAFTVFKARDAFAAMIDAALEEQP
jgi:hypothetical protein